MKKALQKFGIVQKVSFESNNEKSVAIKYQWINSELHTIFTIEGSVKMNQDGTMDFTVNKDIMKEDDVLTYEENYREIHKEIFRAFKNAVKDFLSEYCTKVRKNESEATTDRMLIDHRCITVKGKEYYIPRSYTHDDAQSVIQTYLYDNFQF